MKFVGRQSEFQLLDRFHESRKTWLTLLYGRRCMGKMALLTAAKTVRLASAHCGHGRAPALACRMGVR